MDFCNILFLDVVTLSPRHPPLLLHLFLSVIAAYPFLQTHNDTHIRK